MSLHEKTQINNFYTYVLAGLAKATLKEWETKLQVSETLLPHATIMESCTQRSKNTLQDTNSPLSKSDIPTIVEAVLQSLTPHRHHESIEQQADIRPAMGPQDADTTNTYCNVPTDQCEQ